MTDAQEYWPTEIRLSPAKDCLRVTFDDGAEYALSAEFLRVHSPSAEVKGHGGEDRKILGGKRDVMILGHRTSGKLCRSG